MRFKRLLVVVAAGGAAFGIASAVQASIPDANGAAHACHLTKGKLSPADPRSGDLWVIDTDAGKQRASDELRSTSPHRASSCRRSTRRRS